MRVCNLVLLCCCFFFVQGRSTNEDPSNDENDSRSQSLSEVMDDSESQNQREEMGGGSDSHTEDLEEDMGDSDAEGRETEDLRSEDSERVGLSLSETEADESDSVSLSETEADESDSVSLSETEADESDSVSLSETEADESDSVSLSETEADESDSLSLSETEADESDSVSLSETEADESDSLSLSETEADESDSVSLSEWKADDESGSANLMSNQQPVGQPRFNCYIAPRTSLLGKTVHTLHPGDVKVVGAMGDSLTAGVGADAKIVLDELLHENRGLSWSGGGQGTLDEHVTMPNILRMYSSELWGYATGDGRASSVRAHFNVAVSGATSSGLAEQARYLVDKMKDDDNIDFVNDWKVVTILIGNNDLCDACNHPETYNDAQYYENLVAGLDILHKELPRTLVNLVEPLNMEMIRKVRHGIVCSMIHQFACSCAAFPKSVNAEKRLAELTAQFQRTVRRIATSGRYDTRRDFTVIHQPLFNHASVPLKDDGSVDRTYFAPDCFHLSEKGQAIAAETLWRNMLTPVAEKKSLSWPQNGTYKCSSEAHPFIYTNINSYPPTPAPSHGGFSDFQVSDQLLTVFAVSGVVVFALGVALSIAIYRRFHARQMYIQIPQ